MKTNKTSHSEVESFLMCERRHYYGYGKQLRPISMSEALLRGIVGHSVLERYYTKLKEDADSYTKSDAKDDLHDVIKTYSDMPGLDKIKDNLIEVMEAYIDWYLPQDRDMQVLEVEKEYEIEVSKDFHIKMVVDLVLDTWSGVEVWDNKFVYNFYSTTQARINPQLPKYIWALQKAGFNVNKARYNEIRYRVVKEHESKPEARFQRLAVPINEARLLRVEQEQLSAAKSIQELKNLSLEEWENKTRRTASDVICDRCPFKSICAADMMGEDTSLEESFMYTTERRPRQ